MHQGDLSIGIAPGARIVRTAVRQHAAHGREHALNRPGVADLPAQPEKACYATHGSDLTCSARSD